MNNRKLIAVGFLLGLLFLTGCQRGLGISQDYGTGYGHPGEYPKGHAMNPESQDDDGPGFSYDHLS